MHARLLARLSIFACVAVTIVVPCSALRAAEAAAPQPEIKVPAGFTVELVAGAPLVSHPTMAGFDEQGRLYVCDGPGLNLKAADLLQQLPNNIRRLEDTDGDGRFDRATTFADKMTFPMGAQCYRGAVYTASPPNIWRLRDTDGDGVADERTVLVSEFGFTGNAADVHGCFLAPNGRLYWCDGRHGHTFVDEHGNQISKGLAARLFSCNLAGKDVETFAGGGMDNPVEVTFTTEGEPLGTAAIFDVVEGRHDALFHWVYGGAYPRYDQPCVSEFKRTGELLPPLSRFGQVAPSGVVRYRGSQFGNEFRDNIFLVQFNTHTLVRTQIERDGATFRSRDEDFLTSPDQDFHPTDVLEDADGSLLVINTGGWFRIGCPYSQIAKPEILGGIYRIRRIGAKPPHDPRGLELVWGDASSAEIARRLGDPRPAVRDRAVAELAARGDAAVPQLHALVREGSDPVARGQAVWALCRIGSEPAREAIRVALADRDDSVRQIAMSATGTLRDTEAFDITCELVESDKPQIRRDAATALGRMGQKAAVPVLLSAMRTPGDRFLEHAIIYALIQLDDPAATRKGLADASSQVRRAALIALDQIADGNLTREEVAPLLDTADVALQQTTFKVIEQHEGWAGETAGLLERWLGQRQLAPHQVTMLRDALLAFAKAPKIQELVGETLADDGTSSESRRLLLDVIARAELVELPAAWQTQLGRQLSIADPSVVSQAVATIAARRTSQYDDKLLELVRDGQRPEELRFAALVLLARHGSSLDKPLFQTLLAKLADGVAPVDRLSAAEALAGAALDKRQLVELASHIAGAGPLELPALVGAFEKQNDAELGRLLLAGLEKSPGTENLQGETLKRLLSTYPQNIQTAAQPLIKRLSPDLESQRQRLAELASLTDGGNVARGRQVFFGKKSSCSACHRAGKEGALIGPDLTKVGQIRSKFDQLEAVVFPSASFARGYESYTVVTDGGQVYTGLLSRQTSDSVYLRTAQRDEVRIDRSQIEELSPSKLSIMPQGFDKLLSPQELRDLLAFLQSLK